MSEVRFGRFVRLKFIEKRGKRLLLVIRQQRIDALLCGLLACLLGRKPLFIVGVGVAGVDLHDIMDQAHQHDLRHVHPLVRVFLQKICHNGHMPGVLRVVFAAAMPREMGLAEHILLLVDLQNKVQLAFQPFVHVYRSSLYCRSLTV